MFIFFHSWLYEVWTLGSICYTQYISCFLLSIFLMKYVYITKFASLETFKKNDIHGIGTSIISHAHNTNASSKNCCVITNPISFINIQFVRPLSINSDRQINYFQKADMCFHMLAILQNTHIYYKFQYMLTHACEHVFLEKKQKRPT